MYWLNLWPCRSVEVLGIVVGMNVSENKATLTCEVPSTFQLQGAYLDGTKVDDGTAVIDCIQPFSKPAKTDKKPNPIIDNVPPQPPIGSLVRLVGRVKNHYETRQILMDRKGRIRFQ